MSLTKKRIIALISAFILLITAAILPIGQNLNPFGTIKASAANLTENEAKQIEALWAVGEIEITMTAEAISNMTFKDHGGDDILNISLEASNLGDRQGDTNTSWTRTGSVTFGTEFGNVAGDFTFSGYIDNSVPDFSQVLGNGTFSVYGTTFSFIFGGAEVADSEVTYYIDGIYISTFPDVDIVLHHGDEVTHVYHKTRGEAEIDYFPTPTKEGYTFDGWYWDEELTSLLDPDEDYRGWFGLNGGELWAKYTEIPPPEPPSVSRPNSSSNSSSSSSSSSTPETNPAAEPTTPAIPPALENTTPAADVTVDETPTEDGKIGLTIGGEKVETTSTSAAQAIASGEAKAVVASGSAVAVVKEDNTVVAGANATGSLNSATTVDAVKAAAALLAEGEKQVKVEVGTDVNAISKSTLQKIAAAAAESGVQAKISAAATDETGKAVASIDIPVSETMGDVRTGIVLSDTSIDEAVTNLSAKTGNSVLASFKTEQKSTFGTKVDFAVDTAAIGLEDAAEGDTLYIAIKRADGVTVQVTGKIVEGKLTFSATSAGVMMISDTSFAK